MMRKVLPGVLACTLLFSAGCLGNFTPVQRVQDAAVDLSTATRFGRMDVAFERVSKTGRDQFARRHAAWGSSIRIVDSDILGLRLRDKEHAEVSLAVNWQRLDDSEMRSTEIAQHWKDHQGAWLLETEERAGGDVGLLGETTTVVRPTRSGAQFETITIQ
jgi:hypothetical protein